MALIVTAPEIIGFSKDRNIWHFEDDRAGVIPGVEAMNGLTITGSVPEGAQIVLQWGDNELRYYASADAAGGGNRIPAYTYAVGTHEAYVKSLVPYFQDNYFINEDFTVVAEFATYTVFGETITTWFIRFYAKRPGAAYNMSRRTFNGGIILNGIAGTNNSANKNNSVFIELYLLDADDENPERVWKGAIAMDVQGKAAVDVGDLLHPYLTPEIPSFILPVAQKCQDSRRKYYLRYAQAGGENLSDIGKLITSAEHVIIRGGFGEKKGAPVSLIGKLKAPAGREDKLLMLQGRHRYIREDQPVFIQWINFAETRQVIAVATITFADGRTITTNTNVVNDVKQYEKVMFAVGFRQLNLGIMQGTVSEYTVRIHDNLGPVSEPLRLTLNYAHLEYVRYFAYINSWGAVDTLMTYGRQSSQWKVYRESCEKVMPYHFTSTESQYVEWNQEYEDSSEVASGWIKKSELANYLDLFISPVKFRIVGGVGYAVAINSDSIERGRDGDNLHGVVFTYQYARRFDSLEAEEIENDDVSDYIPPNVVVAGSVIIDTGAGGNNTGGNSSNGIRIDPYPIAGSKNAVESNALYVLLQQKQDTLPLGDSTQYYRADGKLMNFKTAVNAAESDPTVPGYVKTLTSVMKLLADLEELNPGLNAKLFGGQTPEHYLNRAQHPVFSALPPVVVEKGVPFVKYVDLKQYKTSHHEFDELKVDVKINNLKFKGVELEVDGQLVIKLSGKISEDLTPAEQALIVISDLTKNQTTLSLVVQAMEVPEVPDNRPLCPVGPFHHMETPLTVVNNGELKVPFHGNGVTTLGWKILNKQTDTASLRDGQVNPTSSIVTIQFPPLPAGTYVIAISGVNCKSPWVYRTVTIGADTTINWAAGYPKFEGGEFKLKLADTAADQLTEIFNRAGIAMYSATHNYIANTTEISVPHMGGWPDDVYKINVGSLTASQTVGTPVIPTAITWQLRSGWDGAVLRDLLAAGEYESSLNAGWNIYFQSDNLGFAYSVRNWKLELETAPGVWTQVWSGGASVGSGTSTSVQHPDRMFQIAGVDSQFTDYQGAPINRIGKFRATHEFLNGAVPVQTFQKVFQFSKLEIGPQWVIGNSHGTVLVGNIKYNGVAVITPSMAMIEPWASAPLGFRRFEWSVDNITWYETGALGANELPGIGGLLLFDETTPKTLPDGSAKSVRIRNGMNHAIVSNPITIDQRGIVNGTMSLKWMARGLPEHFDLQHTTNLETGVTVFNDLCTAMPAEGYEFWYIINGDVVKRSTPLSGYVYDSYEPIAIYKIFFRIGETNTEGWATFTDPSAGQGFSRNTSYSFYTGYFNRK